MTCATTTRSRPWDGYCRFLFASKMCSVSLVGGFFCSSSVASTTILFSAALEHVLARDKIVFCRQMACLDFFFGGPCEDISVRLSITREHRIVLKSNQHSILNCP